MPGRIGVHPEVLLLLVLQVQRPRAQRQHPLLRRVDLLPGRPAVEVEVELLRVAVRARPLGRGEARRPLEGEPGPAGDVQDDPVGVLLLRRAAHDPRVERASARGSGQSRTTERKRATDWSTGRDPSETVNRGGDSAWTASGEGVTVSRRRGRTGAPPDPRKPARCASGRRCPAASRPAPAPPVSAASRSSTVRSRWNCCERSGAGHSGATYPGAAWKASDCPPGILRSTQSPSPSTVPPSTPA